MKNMAMTPVGYFYVNIDAVCVSWYLFFLVISRTLVLDFSLLEVLV